MLFPDSPDDADGVFSGSAVVRGDTLYLFYTGNIEQQGDFDYITAGRGANTILVATKDGVTMSEKKVLLRKSDYPDYCSCHVRDPKVWEQGGKYRMVLGARTLDDKGCVLFYRSHDLENWEFEKQVRTADFGYMWECPDFLRIGTNDFLSISPQGVAHEEFQFQNVYSSGYLNMNTGVYTEWDCGFDFYAPQSFIAPDGRRILIVWMGIGDIPYTNPTAALEQQQRELERAIRKAKRKVEGFTDPENVAMAKAQLKEKQKQLREFIDKTNADEGAEVLRRDSSREKTSAAELTDKEKDDIIVKDKEQTERREEIRRIREKVIPLMPTDKVTPRQKIHRIGTKEYLDRQTLLSAKGKHGSSYVSVSDDDILSLVNKHKGTGIISLNKNGKWDNTELIVDNDLEIGTVVNNITGKAVKTSVFKIHYGKKGVHIVPDYPSKKKKR